MPWLPDDFPTDTPELLLEQTRALRVIEDRMLGRLKNSDYSDRFVKGYGEAYGEVAHIRAALWWAAYRLNKDMAIAERDAYKAKKEKI